MLNKILGTIVTRSINAFLVFLAWSLNARYLGAENVGTISLIIFSVAIIQLFTNFFSGGALVYMTPRTDLFRLFIPSCIWTLLVTVAASCLLSFLGTLNPNLAVIPDGYFYHVLLLALVMSLASVNLMLLLGREKVKIYNYISLFQTISLLMVLLAGLFLFHSRDVKAFYLAILASWILALIISLIILVKDLKPVSLTGMKNLVSSILRFGTYIQFANIFQQMNYRLSLKIVDAFSGRAAVGVLSFGMTLAEGMWLISRSMAMVQYSRLSNEPDQGYANRITLILIKVTVLITTVVMVMVLLIPGSVYIAVFGSQFSGLRTVIASFSLGIVIFSVSMILSGYFSGINKPYHNTISSAVGLVFTLGLGFLLIPRMGITGAGITASCSYSAATFYQLTVFVRSAKLKLRDFLVPASEVTLLIGLIGRVRKLTPP